jgi:general secretion pathway protein G
MYFRKGFTLVELLLVIAIIAILATVVFPQFLNYFARARDSERRSVISIMNTAITAYGIDKDIFPWSV